MRMSLLSRNLHIRKTSRHFGHALKAQRPRLFHTVRSLRAASQFIGSAVTTSTGAVLPRPADTSKSHSLRHHRTMSVNNSASASRDLEYFKSIPWCSEHLKAANVVTEKPVCRFSKPSTEDELFSKTLSTSDTIPSFLIFFERPSRKGERIDEVKAFLSLKQGVNGLPGACHGGIIITILDEIMGLVGNVNKEWGSIPDTDQMTAYLNTQFLQPVRTPGVILATARIQKFEGRKLFLEAALWDQDSNKLAKGEALFVALKPKI